MKPIKRTEKQEEDYQQNFDTARECLRQLEIKEPTLFEYGSLIHGHQFEKSKIRATLADAITSVYAATKQKPSWAPEAIACAAVAEEYYNNYIGWE